jgi:hypothetical protein
MAELSPIRADAEIRELVRERYTAAEAAIAADEPSSSGCRGSAAAGSR